MTSIRALTTAPHNTLATPGIKWGANLWVWNGDKSGLGKTSNNIELNFYNTEEQPVDVYWNNQGERSYLTSLEPGMGSLHETFHHHTFDMFVVRPAHLTTPAPSALGPLARATSRPLALF
jgi:hypothetical protein